MSKVIEMPGAVAQRLIDTLPADVRQWLKEQFHKTQTPEQFAAMVVVGPCPKCGQNHTMDGDDLATQTGEGPGDTTIGVCLECGHQWCLECLQPAETWPCPHWDAWEAHCKELGIYQGKDAEMEEGYNDAYEQWMEGYIASLQAE